MMGYRPTVSKNEEVWNHCGNKGGSEAGYSVYSRWRGWCPLCRKMRRHGPILEIREELRLDSLCPVDDEGGAHCVSK